MFAFFLSQGGVLPPPPYPHSKAYFTRPDYRLTIEPSVIRPTAAADETAYPEYWPGVTVTRKTPPDRLQRTGGSISVTKTAKKHTAAYLWLRR
jgi:hypothetical protein